MRRAPPPRMAKSQLRRNTKLRPREPLVQRPSRDWVSTMGSLATVVTSILVAVVVAGPENVRNIPKIPAVAYETYNDVMAKRRRDHDLTGKWVAKVPEREGAPAFKMIFELATNDGATSGMMTTPATVPWSNSEFTDFEAAAKGEFLEIEFWGFILGNRKTFAKSRIRIVPETCPTICEEEPKIDFDNLTLETYWQVKPVLPPTLLLKRT